MNALVQHGADGSLILVLNCGSSSIKFALFEQAGGVLPQQAQWSGKVEGIGRENADLPRRRPAGCIPAARPGQTASRSP